MGWDLFQISVKCLLTWFNSSWQQVLLVEPKYQFRHPSRKTNTRSHKQWFTTKTNALLIFDFWDYYKFQNKTITIHSKNKVKRNAYNNCEILLETSTTLRRQLEPKQMRKHFAILWNNLDKIEKGCILRGGFSQKVRLYKEIDLSR